MKQRKQRDLVKEVKLTSANVRRFQGTFRHHNKDRSNLSKTHLILYKSSLQPQTILKRFIHV